MPDRMARRSSVVKDGEDFDFALDSPAPERASCPGREGANAGRDLGVYDAAAVAHTNHGA